MDENAVVLHVPLDHRNDIIVLKRKYPVALVDEVDLCLSESCKNGGILTANDTGADNYHALRKLIHMLNTVACHYDLFIDRYSGQLPRATARSQNDIVTPNRLLYMTADDFNFILIKESGCSGLKCQEVVVAGRRLHEQHVLLQHGPSFFDSPFYFILDFL